MRHCPACGFTWAWKLDDGRYKCRSCSKRYTWKTVWSASRLPEATKRRLLELFVYGVPVYRQRFRENASSSATERFYRLIRACCAHAEELREPFDGDVECDETTFGGARKGKRGWGAAGKIIVFGIVKRNGLVKAFPLPARRKVEIMRLIREHTKPGSLYYTDEWQAYASLRLRGEHVVVRKEQGRPKGRDHVNGVEGFWSYAKNWLYPYRGISRIFFHLFLGEICFRFNHHNEDIYPILYKLLHDTPIDVIDSI